MRASWLSCFFHARFCLVRLYLVSPWTPEPHAWPLYFGIFESVASSVLRCHTGPLLRARFFFAMPITSSSRLMGMIVGAAFAVQERQPGGGQGSVLWAAWCADEG